MVTSKQSRKTQRLQLTVDDFTLRVLKRMDKVKGASTPSQAVEILARDIVATNDKNLFNSLQKELQED